MCERVREKSVCVWCVVCVRERERESVCKRVRERERVCVFLFIVFKINCLKILLFA